MSELKTKKKKVRKKKIKVSKKKVVIKDEVLPEHKPDSMPKKYIEKIKVENPLKLLLLHEKRNIYCGELRRIGKTTALIEVIKSFKVNRDDKVAILVPVSSLSTDWKNYVDEVLTPITFNGIIAKMLESKPANIYLFSDEISNVDQYLKNWNIQYMGGFYSRILTKIEKYTIDKKKENATKLITKLRSLITDIEKL